MGATMTANSQGWEYWVWIPTTTWDKKRNRHILEEVDQNTPLVTWSDVLNHVGAVGWELVTVTDRPNAPVSAGSLGTVALLPGQNAFFFKRPLSSE